MSGSHEVKTAHVEEEHGHHEGALDTALKGIKNIMESVRIAISEVWGVAKGLWNGTVGSILGGGHGHDAHGAHGGGHNAGHGHAAPAH